MKTRMITPSRQTTMTTSEHQHPPRCGLMFEFVNQREASAWYDLVTAHLDTGEEFTILLKGEKRDQTRSQ